jgi:hypothetical protein
MPLFSRSNKTVSSAPEGGHNDPDIGMCHFPNRMASLVYRASRDLVRCRVGDLKRLHDGSAFNHIG